ncbi:MAG: hypothetical protein JW751_06105 [Polyangiaceae bacterium]|nr:hypothetical protein [Polyangiaceae bacterium]
MQCLPPHRALRQCLAATLVVALFAACGGTKPEAATPDDDEGDDRDPSGPTTATDRATAAKTYCTDDSCFNCGDSFCMVGWYCDLSLSGGPACTPLPECDGAADCDCVSAALGGNCRCEERGGGLYLTCG